MTLAAPWWLVAWPVLVALVLALHVRRRHEVVVGSVRLWRALGATSGARPKLAPPRPSWPLALQLAAATLVVWAVARPALDAPVDHQLVVVEAGAAMLATDLAPDRAAAARDVLTRVVGGAAASTDVSIVRAGLVPEVVAWRLPGGRTAARAIARVTPVDAPVDWAAAVARADALRREGETVRLTIVASAESVVAVEAAAAAYAGSVEIVPIGGVEGNVGLESVAVVPAGDGRWRLTGTVRWFGDTPSEVDVAFGFEPAGTVGVLALDERSVARGPDGMADLDVTFAAPGQGLVRVWLPEDAFTQDDVRWARAVRTPAPVRVVAVGEVGAALERALTAVARVELYRSVTWPADAASFDLVVAPADVVGAEPVTSTWWIGGRPGDLAPAGAAPVSAPVWTDALEHPLGRVTDWSSLGLRRAVVVPRLEGADVLAATASGPLVQARTADYGRELVTAFAPEDGDWPAQIGFPTFVAALVDWVAPPDDQVCSVARACALPAWAAAGFSVIDEAGAVVAKAGPIAGADSVGVWLDRGFDTAFVPTRSGRFIVRAGERERTVLVVSPVVAVGPSSEGPWPPGVAAATTPAPWRVLLAVALVLVVVDVGIGWIGRGRNAGRPGARLGGAAGARRRRSAWAFVAAIALWAVGLVAVGWPSIERGARLVTVVEAGADPEAVGSFRTALAAEARVRDVVDVAPTRDAAPRPWGAVADPLASTTGTVALGPALELAAAAAIERDPVEVRLLLSGRTDGTTLRAGVEALAAAGVPVTITPLSSGAEMPGIERVLTPREARSGDRFPVVATLWSDAATDLEVVFLQDGQVVDRRTVAVPAGRSTIDFETEAGEIGPLVVEVELPVVGARSGAVVDVVDGPRVRVVTSQPAWGRVLVDTLTGQGMVVDQVVPVDAAWRFEDWADVDVVALANVPAIELHSQQQEALRTWVRDHGGGLLVLGGENAFGPGGYYRTVLEDVSPFSSEVPRDVPQVAMLFVLDRSGSMQQRVGPVTRLDVAKEATVAALDLLGDQSQIGIVAFDELASVVSPMRSTAELDTIVASLDPLRANGGTAIYPALELGLELMEGVDAAARHVVVFTDGMSQPADFAPLMRAYRAAEITVSFVGVGQGTDANQLSALARAGGGAFHQTNDFRALPGILAQEALMLSATPIEEGATPPVRTGTDAAFLADLPDRLPDVTGYVATTAKPGASVHLAVGEDDPLLGSWAFGLGRVIAFTAHGAGAWTASWLQDPAYPRLWSQVVEWLAPRVVPPGGTVRVDQDGDRLLVTVDVLSSAGAPSAGRRLDVQAKTVDGALLTGTRLVETVPGRYEGALTDVPPGPVQITVVDPTGDLDLTAWAYAPDPSRPYVADAREAERLRAVVASVSATVADAAVAATVPTSPRWTLEPRPWRWVVAGAIAWLVGLVVRSGLADGLRLAVPEWLSRAGRVARGG